MGRENHQIDWEGTRLTASESQYSAKWIREAISIKRTPNMNRDGDAYRLSDITFMTQWSPKRQLLAITSRGLNSRHRNWGGGGGGIGGHVSPPPPHVFEVADTISIFSPHIFL